MAKPIVWMEKDKIYGRSQAIQRIFDISRETVNQWVKKYKLPVEKDGRTTKYNLKNVVDWKVELQEEVERGKTILPTKVENKSAAIIEDITDEYFDSLIKKMQEANV